MKEKKPKGITFELGNPNGMIIGRNISTDEANKILNKWRIKDDE